ncbi:MULTISPECIES: hypothetical protein [Flavobacteriaceae]|nr:MULTISPECIES: hypothetical protein [Flavobacteriaceae]
MEFRFGGLRSRFRIGNEASRSSAAERVSGMESRNWGWCPRLL